MTTTTLDILADLIDACYQRGLDAAEAAAFIRDEGWTLVRSQSWGREHRCKAIGGYIGSTALRCFGDEGHDGVHSY